MGSLCSAARLPPPLTAAPSPSWQQAPTRRRTALSPSSIPVDRPLLETDAFYALLGRLRRAAEREGRDWWAQCCRCGRWRIVPYEVAQARGLCEPWALACQAANPRNAALLPLRLAHVRHPSARPPALPRSPAPGG